MTLFVVLVFGAGAVLLISGWENTSLLDTVKSVWNGPDASAAPGVVAPTPLTRGQKGGTGMPDSLAYQQAIVRAWVRSQHTLYQ